MLAYSPRLATSRLPPQHELDVGAEQGVEHDADEGESGAANHVVQILPGGRLGLLGHGVDNQRQRHHGQRLVEQVHGDDVAREGHAQRHAVGDGVEGQEGVHPLLVAHIFKGVQRRQRPQAGHQPAEEGSHAVDVQRQGQALYERKQIQPLRRGVQQQHKHQNGVEEHHCLHRHVPRPVVLNGEGHQQNPRQDGEQDGHQNEIRTHTAFSSPLKVRWRLRRSAAQSNRRARPPAAPPARSASPAAPASAR